jgi:hypothetical protein
MNSLRFLLLTYALHSIISRQSELQGSVEMLAENSRITLTPSD